MAAYLLVVDGVLYESSDLSGKAWVQEPFPAGGPNGVIALATGASANGWVFDRGAALWRRTDQRTFTQIATGDLSPKSLDFYTFPPYIPPTRGGTTVVGDLRGQPPTYVKSTDGGLTAPTFPFPPSLQFPANSTFIRLWADQRTGANFLAQVRDPSNIDHLYYSPDLQTWTPVALPGAALQAALLVATAFNTTTSWLPSQFSVGPQDHWFTVGGTYQETVGTALVIASQGTAGITPTGGGQTQTTQFVLRNAIGGIDTALQVMAVLFDMPGVTFASGPFLFGMGGNVPDYRQVVTLGGRTFLIMGLLDNPNAPLPIPAGTVYGIRWTNATPPGWTKATVLSMVLDFVGNHDILFGGLDNVANGQNASPVTVNTGPTRPNGVPTPLQFMHVLTDGVPASLSVGGSNFTVPPGGTDPMGPQPVIRDIRGDFIRKQNGTYLVAVDLAATGAPAIARSTDGVTWTFTSLPNTARPTPGLTECDDGTVLVPSDGAAGPGLVLRSTDDGQSFQVALTPSGVTTAHVGLKYFPGLNTLFAYVSKDTGSTTSPGTAVYVSSDQGQSWSPVFTSATSAPLPSQQSTSWMALTQGSTYWGVDSLTPANSKVRGKFLYDIVKGQTGRAPAFWGRYIGPKGGNLKSAEVTFLHDPSRNCRILLIYRDTYSYKVKGKLRIFTYDDGVFHANNAITSANGLGVPGSKRVWIYLDTEVPPRGQSPAADFFRGWSDTMLSSQFGGAGGVYGNTYPGQDFDVPYCAAYTSDANMRLGSTPALLWTNQPNKPCPTNPTAPPPPFAPTIPPCGAPTVLYQYSIDCSFNGAPVDLDQANDAGLASMWAP